MDTIQLVQTAEPVPPRRLVPGIPADLQTICLKCLEKDPAKRYPSASEFAADLGRFLSGQPIHARPVGTWERTWKYVCRHPAAAALIALCFLAPAAIAGVSVAYSFRLQAETNRAVKAEGDAIEKKEKSEKAQKEAIEERQKAERAKAAAEAATKKALAAEEKAKRSEAEALAHLARGQGALDRVLRVAQNKLRDLGGTEAARSELLAEGLRMARYFLDRRGSSLPDQLRGAQAAALAGEIEAQLGKHAEAIKLFDLALECYDAVLAASVSHRLDPSFQSQAAEVCLLRWASQEAVKNSRSLESLEAALARIARMPDEVRSSQAVERTRASVLHTRALHKQERGQDPRGDYAASLKVLEGLESGSDLLLERGRVLSNLAAYETAMGARSGDKRLLKAADDAGRRAIDVLREARKAGGDADTLAALGKALGNRGLLLLALGDRKEAVKVLDGAVAEFREVRRQAPLNADYRHLLASALVTQGIGRHQARQFAAAEKPLREALEILEPLVRDNPEAHLYRMAQAQAQAALGNALDEQGKREEAIRSLTEARKGFQAAAKGRGDARAAQDAWSAWANLVRCHDLMAREADRLGRTESALAHLGELSGLREEKLEALPIVPGDWKRFAERCLAGADLLLTEEVRARLLALSGDHRSLAASVAKMASLAPRWPLHLDNLGRMARAVTLAGTDRELKADERVRLQRRYAEQALALARGLKHLPGFDARLAASDLDPLRAVPEVGDGFRKLLVEGGR